MENQHSYDTLSEAVNALAKRGYTSDFSILTDAEKLLCHTSSTHLSPDEFEIDETYRFEGNTDPGDEMILFAISSIKHNLKGVLVNGYGVYANAAASAIVARLKTHL